MDNPKSGMARVIRDDGNGERVESIERVTLIQPGQLKGSDITTGMAHANQGQYENCTDEYLAKLLSGVLIFVQNPNNKELIREVQLRLVTRGADGRGGERMTMPTLEGLEQRLDQLERDIKEITGIDPQQVRDANQGR